MGQWEKLPSDLLMDIEERLISYRDKIRFSFVCRSWRSALLKLPNLKQPWLLLPRVNRDGDDQSLHGLFNILEKKAYFLDLPKPEGLYMLFRGSSHGWIITLEGSQEIYLMNPLTRTKIKLPPRSKFPDVMGYCADDPEPFAFAFYNSCDRLYTLSWSHVRVHLTGKMILSANPSSSDDYVVVCIHGEFETLSYWKPGDEEWTYLYGGRREIFRDAIFYKGKLYALNMSGKIWAIDLCPCPRVKLIARSPGPLVGDSEIYLVPSSIGLLMVQRHIKTQRTSDPDNFLYTTHRFDVFKLVRKRLQWRKVTNIGEDILFIGYNSSVSKSSADFPPGLLKGNRIYFTDNVTLFHCEGILGGYDIGVFDLDSGSIEPLPGYKCDQLLVWPPPVWVIPTP